jgi:hypothetical protein
MAATGLFSGPLPAGGEEWCVVCARLYKGAYLQLPAVAERVQEANAAGPETLMRFDISFPRGQEPQLREAVATTMLALPTQIPLPDGRMVTQSVPMLARVCWTHLDALIIKDGGVLAYSAADLPAERGAVILGQRRG